MADEPSLREIELLMRQVASETAEKTVKATLTKLGVDHYNPLEVQKDLAALRELRRLMTDSHMQADLMHLRKWRIAVESVQKKGMVASLGLIIVALIVIAATSLKWKVGIP